MGHCGAEPPDPQLAPFPRLQLRAIAADSDNMLRRDMIMLEARCRPDTIWYLLATLSHEGPLSIREAT